MPNPSMLIILVLTVWNLFTFLLMGHDKRLARSGGWRVPERTLLACAACAGAIGVLAGMRCFHHKTKHPVFTVGVPIMLAAQIAVVIWAVSSLR